MSGTVLVIGREGQIARALVQRQVMAGRTVVAVGRPEADLAIPESLSVAIAKHGPRLVVNAGAFTAVDAAESRREEAFRVNASGAGALARACATASIPLIHLSTDYVFDGNARRPYREDDPVAPLSVYGASKWEGERQVRAAGGCNVILRTSWVYSDTGRNFLTTMLRLAGDREVVRVVDDQEGSPTFADDVADAIATIAETALGQPGDQHWGTFHFANAGTTTWHGLARAIFDQAAALGWPVPRLEPITTAQYPTPARRPAYSVLDSGKLRRAFGIDPAPWREAVRRCLVRLKQAGGLAA
jgi:dTDP-4-dehydrorhamnose reductase